MVKYGSYIPGCGMIRIILLIMLLSMPFAPTYGTTSVTSDTITHKENVTVSKKRNFFYRTVDFIDSILEQDTTFVSPNIFNMKVTPEYIQGFEYYRFSTKDNEQSITFSPTLNNKIGMYLSWRWITLGYSFSLNDIHPQFDMEFLFYSSRVGLELYYRKSNEGFKIRGLKGFNDIEYNKNFDGLSTSQMEANLFYIFNYKKYSFPAAFSQSTIQRRNAGSFILGLNYNVQTFTFDHTRLDPSIESLMKNDLKFQNAGYKNININFGYSYNWAFANNFLANITFSPAIGYKNTSLSFYENSSKEFISSINFDLISRMSLTYNNGHYYAGALLTSHTYSYSHSAISIMNGFGYLKIYAGLYFWKKKKK